MSLLDTDIDEYIIKPIDSWRGNTIHLEDKNGNLLGKAKVGWWGYGKNSLFDSDESLVLKFQQKGFFKSLHDYYEIKNSSGKLIGKIRIEGSKKTDFLLENVDGNKILKSKLLASENSCGIYHNADKLISTIKFHRHKSFWKKLYGDAEAWTLQIHDTAFDRMLLLGFCLSIYHSQISTGSGPGA